MKLTAFKISWLCRKIWSPYLDYSANGPEEGIDARGGSLSFDADNTRKGINSGRCGKSGSQ